MRGYLEQVIICLILFLPIKHYKQNSYAIKMDMLTDNPCRRVTIPKGDKKERKILTIEQTEEFIKLLQTAPLKYRAFFTLDIYSGMRRGEMLGLEWKDIDFETGVIHIQRTSNYTKARGIYTDTTKTESSVRYVKVPPEIVDILRQYKAEQDTEREKLGSKWHDTDRLFVKFDGRPMNPQTPYGWLKEFCKKNGLPFYGIHQFRHLHTSLLIGAGIDPTTVSGLLGHSQVTTTVNLLKGHTHQSSQYSIKTRTVTARQLSIFMISDTSENGDFRRNGCLFCTDFGLENYAKQRKIFFLRQIATFHPPKTY